VCGSKTTRLFEIRDVAKASHSSVYRHDLAVKPFGHHIGDPMRTAGHNIIDSFFQIACEFLHRSHLVAKDSLTPIFAVAPCPPLGLVGPDFFAGPSSPCS
jgi:hypothetical protein